MSYDPYIYRAKIVRVYDGDTVTAEVDLGFDIKRKMTIRLAGINTPELYGEEREKGLLARDYLASRILDREVTIKTKKDKKGKYGRYIAIIYLNGEDINLDLVRANYAVTVSY